jgi:DNA-binding MarR family transcriptional regulator
MKLPLERASPRGFHPNPQHSVGYLLRDTSRAVLRDTAALLEPHGITLPQYFVLRELWQEPGTTQRELAQRVGVAEPAMVATLDALEGLGLVARERSTRDRRKTQVALTERGTAFRATFLGYAQDVLERALDGVTDDEIATMRRVLHRMKDNLARTDSE